MSMDTFVYTFAVPQLGVKKGGGLGAQRVKKDFGAIEKEAARNDQLRQEAKQLSKEEQQQSVCG